MKFKGRAWTFGDDIDTDVIISGKYLRGEDPKVWGEHVFEVLGKEHSSKIKPGDIIVGGDNFGCGSSREQAAIAIKEAGASAVVAGSFGRIFFRNAVNIGLPVFVCPDIKTASISDEDEIEIDMNQGRLVFKDKVLKVEKLPDFMVNIINAGGLLNYYNKFEANNVKT